jgi:hypothetical protein
MFMYGFDSLGNNQEHTEVKMRKNDSHISLPFPYCCGNLVLGAPIDTSGETLSMQAVVFERASVLRVFLVTDKPNLGYYSPCVNKKHPTNGYVVATSNL